MGAYSDAVLATPGLVSYWPGDDPGDGILRDLADGNPATINGAGVTVDAPIIAGEEASTLWPGVGAGVYANAAHAANMDLPVDLTLEVWLRTQVGAVSRTLVRRTSTYLLRITTTGAIQASIYQATVAKNLISTALVNDGATHHVAMTFETASRTLRIWLDGKVANSIVLAAGGADVTGAGLTLGAISGGSETFAGNLAGHALYGAALSGARVQHHYRLGAGLERRAITERLFTFKAGTDPTIDGSVRCPLAGAVDLSDAYAGGGVVTADDEVARRLRALGIFDEAAA